jgi:hypothetical protein
MTLTLPEIGFFIHVLNRFHLGTSNRMEATDNGRNSATRALSQGRSGT